MTKEALDFIRSSVEKIPQPQDYFKGLQWGGPALPDNVVAFVRTGGYDINRDPPNVFHSRNVLLVPLSGTGRVVVNGRVFLLEPGNCLFIEPYQFHHYSNVQTDALCWLFITFDGDARLGGGVFSIHKKSELHHDLAAFVGGYTAQEPPARALILRVALILEYLRGVTQRHWPQKSSSDETLLLRVHQLTLSHLESPLSVGELSARLGMSQSALRVRFRKISGYSVGNFQQRIRLLEASKMLRQRHFSVSQTAAACGWDSPYSFSRAFSAYWGIPPKPFSVSGESFGRQSG